MKHVTDEEDASVTSGQIRGRFVLRCSAGRSMDAWLPCSAGRSMDAWLPCSAVRSMDSWTVLDQSRPWINSGGAGDTNCSNLAEGKAKLTVVSVQRALVAAGLLDGVGSSPGADSRDCVGPCVDPDTAFLSFFSSTLLQ